MDITVTFINRGKFYPSYEGFFPPHFAFMNIKNSKYAIKSHLPFNGKYQLNHEREPKKTKS